jgi:exopolyphosphatase/guanosine-5'-triphosphate,3'-diphosphate pyrophosphatase
MIFSVASATKTCVTGPSPTSSAASVSTKRRRRGSAASALDLLRQVAKSMGSWRQGSTDVLERAARLHEIGLLLTHDQYHKHGAYVLQHSDLPGYSRDDQQLLAALVRRHRRSFPADAFADLPKDWARRLRRRLCALLRLAVVLHRGRSNEPLPAISLRVEGQRMFLSFPPAWLVEHPLTRADLQMEARVLRKAGLELRLGNARGDPGGDCGRRTA